MRWLGILLLFAVAGCRACQIEGSQDGEAGLVAVGPAHATADIVPATATIAEPMPISFPWISGLGSPGEVKGTGYLYPVAFNLEGELQGPARSYQPQAGDIFLCTDHVLIVQIGHKLAGGQSPHHSGLVIMRPDGSPASLESGPHNTIWVRVLDLVKNLGKYEEEGESVWIRQRKTPLTAEQSKMLTHFAMAQDGKLFAWGRVLGQLTPFRSRGPLRTYWMGGPHGNRFSYFCSELVLESLLAAGLLDPNRTRPAATYPCDLFFGTSDNSFINQNLDINASWEPPARWSLSPRGP